MCELMVRVIHIGFALFVQCVKLLLEFGATVLVVDLRERTPLFWCHAGSCALLFAHLSAEDSMEHPLHAAANRGDIETMCQLLDVRRIAMRFSLHSVL